jgi:hypothetical protein
MNYSYSTQEIKKIATSTIAKSETNDCFVKALASAADVDYDTAHSYSKEKFGRQDKKGTMNYQIIKTMAELQQNGMEIGSKKFTVEVLPTPLLTNRYKVHGKVYDRKKTVKSFIKSLPQGSFIVCVSNHAFAVKDGILIDNKGEEFRPTRKVLAAYALQEKPTYKQLELF